MIYIGRHSTNKLEDGYLGSGKLITHAIREFGKENFTREILFIFDNVDLMIQKEVELVTDDFRTRFDTYNCALGGGEWCTLGMKLKPRSDEYRKNMSKAKKGKHTGSLSLEHREKAIKTLVAGAFEGHSHTNETKAKMSEVRSGEGNPMFGKTHTLESIEKNRQSNRGKKRSIETRKKMSASQKGKKRSPRTAEHTEKLRQANLGRKQGPHSAEHKAKLSAAKLGKPKSEETKQKIRSTNLKKSFHKRAAMILSILNSVIANIQI